MINLWLSVLETMLSSYNQARVKLLFLLPFYDRFNCTSNTNVIEPFHKILNHSLPNFGAREIVHIISKSILFKCRIGQLSTLQFLVLSMLLGQFQPGLGSGAQR